MIEQKKLSYRDTVRYGSCVANMVFGSGEGQITIKFSGELHPPERGYHTRVLGGAGALYIAI